MISTVCLEAKSLKQLGQLAIDNVGECVGIRWQLTGSQGYRRAAVYYAHVFPESQREALEKLDGMFDEPEGEDDAEEDDEGPEDEDDSAEEEE